MKNIKYFLVCLAAVLLGAMPVLAVQISVPSAPSKGYMLVSTTTGAWIATTTDPAHFGSIFATSTSVASILTFASTTALSATTLYGALVGNASTATALAANGTNCSAGNYPLGIDASGNVENCTLANTGTVTAVSVASANGFAGSSGGGATPALTLTTSITGLLKGNGTAISAAAYTDFPTMALNTVLANQTSGTAAPTAVATSTFFGQPIPGYSLAFLNNQWIGAATTTFTSPLVYTQGAVTCPTCQTSAGAFAFTPTTNFAANTNATNTPIWFQQDVQASGTIKVGTGAAANAVAQFFNNALGWIIGYDNSNGAFEISKGTTLGTNNAFAINTNSLNITTLFGSSTAQTLTTLYASTTLSTVGMFGTTSTNFPIAPLVVGSSTAPQILLTDNAPSISEFFMRVFNKSFWFGTTTPNGLSTSTNPILTFTASTTNTGLLGVGTSTPQAALDVNGTIKSGEQFFGSATTSNMTIDWSASSTIGTGAQNQTIIQIGPAAQTVQFVNFYAGETKRLMICNPAQSAGALTITYTYNGNTVSPLYSTAPAQTTTGKHCDMWSYFASVGTSTTGLVEIFGAQTPF